MRTLSACPATGLRIGLVPDFANPTERSVVLDRAVVDFFPQDDLKGPGVRFKEPTRLKARRKRSRQASARLALNASFPPGNFGPGLTCAAISLMGQCSVFVANREQLAPPPFNLKIDEAFVARLTDFISELALNGMTRQSRRPMPESLSPRS